MSYELLQDRPAVFCVDPKLIQDRFDAGFFRPEYARFDASTSGSTYYDVIEIGSRKATVLFTHMPGFSKDEWVKYVPEGIPYLLQINVQEGYVEPSGWQYITPLAHANLKTSSLKPGDVLLTATGMHYGKAAVVPGWLKTANACPDIFRMVLREWIDPYYLVAYLNCEYGQMELRRHGSGAGRPRIITEYARKVRLVLPSRPVQVYIGAKVRLAERCRVRARGLREEASDYIDELLGLPYPSLAGKDFDSRRCPMTSDQVSTNEYQVFNHKPLVMSVPPELLDPGRMDLDYYRPRFVEAVARIRESGLSMQPLDTLRDSHRIITDGVRKHTKTESGVVLVRTQNFEDTSLNLEDCVYIDIEQHRAAQKSAVRTGDLLVAIRGYLGKAVIVGSDVPTANINQHIARVAVDPDKADPGYLWAFFSSPTGTAVLEQRVTGTVQRGIMLPALRQLQVPLPPRPVQEHIGAKVQLAEQFVAKARKLIREAKADVEALIEGQLDVEGIIAGRVQPPTWEDPEV